MKNIFIISGKALKNARKAIPNLDQKDMATALEMSRSTYTNWEAKEEIEVDATIAKKLQELLKVDINVLTNVPHETTKPDILEHPVIKSLVEQSQYIMGRVRELEAENRMLKSQQKN